MRKRVRNAFVTGGSGAIGVGICRALAKEGFSVAIGYCNHRDDAEKLAQELKAQGLDCFPVFCNIVDYESVKAAKTEADKHFGAVDTLINCAGVEAYRMLCDETAETINRTLSANLNGTIFACEIFSEDMVKMHFGRIINISSVWGVCGAAVETVYSAAKSGVIGFGKALAAELASSGITVNTVSPGFIDTPMNSRFSENERNAILEEIPVCRFGTAQDVAAAVAFFASESAEYITGQNLVVAGGYKNI